MGRVRRERIYRNFAGGLNTEFGKLSFPENALTAALNVVLKKDGALGVRDGVALTGSEGYDVGTFSTDWLPMSSYVWHSAAGTDVDLLVVGINNYNSTGPLLLFFSIDGTNTFANYVGELSLSEIWTGDTSSTPIQMTEVGNVLVAAGDNIAFPAYILYKGGVIIPWQDVDAAAPDDSTPGSFLIALQYRDFADASTSADGLRPISLTDSHKYDLWNRGWPSEDVAISGSGTAAFNDKDGDAIEHFRLFNGSGGYWKFERRFNRFTGETRYVRVWVPFAGGSYPSKGDPYLGGSKSTYGRLDYRLYKNLPYPIGSVPKGKFIISAASNDRSDASGIEGIPGTFSAAARFTVVAGFAGRAWYAGSTEQSQANSVFYSQIVVGEDYAALGKCYQANDPTDPDVNDVLDTDGGVVTIDGAGRILQLIPFSNSMVVLATNGVWEIGSGEEGFKPATLRVRKLSSSGAMSKTCGVLAETAVVYLAKGGIFAVQADPTLGTLSAANISENTIQTFYRQNIPDAAKLLARAVYDDYNRLVYWLYPDNDISDSYYNAALVLDTRLSAFYPLSFEITEDSPKMMDMFMSPPVGVSTFQEEVTVDGVVVTVDDVAVYTVESQGSTGFSDVLFMCLDTTTGELLQAAMIDRDKADWGTEQYSAYAETGDDIVEDPSRMKDVASMTAWFTITEDEVVDIGGGHVDFAHKSKCRFRAKWEWTDTATANRWSTQDNIYQLPVNYTPSGVETEDVFDYSYSVATVKRAVNGSGRALRMRFENYPGYGFELIGVAIAFTVEEIN